MSVHPSLLRTLSRRHHIGPQIVVLARIDVCRRVEQKISAKLVSPRHDLDAQ